MKIIVAYVTVTGGPLTTDYAARFVASYTLFPAGAEHQLVVICNGGPPFKDVAMTFLPAPCIFYPRSNEGWDIGGYLDVARHFSADMLVCLGESVHFHRAGWLRRLADAWEKYGPGMYGPFASNLVRPHMNTTAFACESAALAVYPASVSNRASRYEFEHGNLSMWRRMQAQKKPVRLVTWDGDYEPRNWRNPPNILWRGNQSNCLMFCSHTDRYRTATPELRRTWERGADRAYRG